MLDERPTIDRPRYYYLAPVWRRLVLIVVCGLIVVPITFIVIQSRLLGQPMRLHVGGVLFVCASCAMMLSLLRARVSVDTDGIARRGFVGWRTYSWAEISGQPARTLCVGQQPWFDAPTRIRRLYSAFAWLKESDLWSLFLLITPQGTCTHIPQMPSRFRMKVIGFKSLELDEEGLRFEDDGGLRSWFWNDVRLVTIRKERHTNPGNNGIRIELSDGTRLSRIDDTIECECPCQCRYDYLLEQFLRSVLRDDQILIRANQGEPRTITEATSRCEATRKGLRIGRNYGWCCAIGTGALLLIGLAVENESCVRIALLLISYELFFGPMYWGLMREQRKKHEMLQVWLEEHAESDGVRTT